MNDNLRLFQEINAILNNRLSQIFAQKEVIPWASNRSGICYAVTTSTVGYQMEKAQAEIMEQLRGYTVKANEPTELDN